jgi:integrase
MKKEKNITEIIPNEKYRIDIEKGKKYDGSRNRYTETFYGTLKEAISRRDDLVYEFKHSKTKPTGNMNLLEYSKFWINNYAEPNVKPSTLYSYKCMLNSYILPRFKNYKLNEFKVYDLEAFYRDLSKRPTKVTANSNNPQMLSSTTILKVHRLLNLMFNTAMKWDFLDVNPCSKIIKAPTNSPSEIEFYSEVEIKKIFELLEDEEIGFKTAIFWLILSGVRRGELLSLTQEDINWDNHTIRISKNLQSIGGKGLITGTPKTSKSVRTISLPNKCFELLKEYETAKKDRKKLLGNQYHESSYIFQSIIGGVMKPDWLTREWKRFLKKNNLRELVLHSLRHSFATYLISIGTPISAVSRKLGHSDAYTTWRYYIGSVEADDKKAVEELENRLLK